MVAFPLIAAAGYGLLLVFATRSRVKRGRTEGYLLLFLALSVALALFSAGLYLWPDTAWLRNCASAGWASSLLSLVFLTLNFGRWKGERVAAAGGAIWLAALILLGFLGRGVPVLSVGIDREVLYPRFDLVGAVFLSTWLLGSSGLTVLTPVASARAKLPLHANRLLYWGGALGLVFTGQALASIREPALNASGFLLQLLGAVGLTYGVSSYHLFDVRRFARRSLAFVLSTVAAAAIIAAAVVMVPSLAGPVVPPVSVRVVLGVALLLAAAYQTVRPLIDRLLDRLIVGQGRDSAFILEAYSRTIGNVLEISALSSAVSGVLRDRLDARRGGLLLVGVQGRSAVITPTGGLVPDSPMSFPLDGTLFSRFCQHRVPLTQYEVDVLPEFADLSQAQRTWLAELQMDMFFPIVPDVLPIGLLAVGPKLSGEPYSPDEQQLLQTLAGQTVGALANALLFQSMARLNTEIQRLNDDLRRSNERLRYMDQVKTDFITIASHELRTPLTQIRGYADIMDAMNEERRLTPVEAAKMLESISQASQQLETVIAAMLDVSQLDVDAMSLNLSEINLDTVLRMAIQPLAQAIRERNLAISVQGVRNLPPFMGDLQRLVQAAGNLMSNAVKFTPDRGRITVTAALLEDEHGEGRQVELVVADTGVGIDRRDHELIFEKFYRASDPQLHSTGSTKFMGAGPGLGLAIVRGIVEAHGGRIWVESEGRDPETHPGSEFHVLLPLRPVGSMAALDEALSQADVVFDEPAANRRRAAA